MEERKKEKEVEEEENKKKKTKMKLFESDATCSQEKDEERGEEDTAIKKSGGNVSADSAITVAMKTEQRLKAAAGKAEKVLDLAETVVPEGVVDDMQGVADGAFEAVLQLGEAIPFAGHAVKLIHMFYAAAKGAEYNKQSCLVLAKKVKKVERLLGKANKTKWAAEKDSSIKDVEDAISWLLRNHKGSSTLHQDNNKLARPVL